MERRKKVKGRTQPSPAPETREALDRQVAGVAAALAADADQDALEYLIHADPQDPGADAYLIAALAALNDAAIPALLAAHFGEARDKIRRKALKKALHGLKTRGVPVADDLLPREEASVGAPRPASAAVHVSAFFGDGERYVILEGPSEALGGNFLASRLNDRTGFQECVLMTLNRKHQKEVWAQFREQGLDEWFSPPPAYAVRLLEEAYAGHPGGGSGTAQYEALRSKIFQHFGRPEEAPDLEEVLPPVPESDRQGLLVESRNLAMDRLFHAWLPSPEEINPWLEKLQEVESSPLVLSEQQKQIRADALLEEATRALYPLESRADLSRRLKEAAYHLHLKGREYNSQVARAAAADLEETDRSQLAGENIFLKGLIQYVAQLAWEFSQPPEPETPSGLVSPESESLIIRR